MSSQKWTNFTRFHFNSTRYVQYESHPYAMVITEAFCFSKVREASIHIDFVRNSDITTVIVCFVGHVRRANVNAVVLS